MRHSDIIDFFNFHTPYAIGFDTLVERLNQTCKYTNTDTYPPYNIVKESAENFKIEMALAGFDKTEIEISVADGVLTVKSIKENKQSDDNLYRGISYRKFDKKFTLAEDVVVKDAELINGLLSIKLEKILPEEKKPRKITIN
tara:strand:+ start:396 stop:821 length:426 start_codon:yes stop_codon:yes gene_type:complete